MSRFVGALENAICTHDRQKAREIMLTQIPFQKIQLETKRLFETFSSITVIKIVECDLRTLDNFPVLPALTELHLSHNKLQGSLKNVVQLHRLNYIDLSNNLITKSINLSPLKKLKGITVCVLNNPFTRKEDDWKNAIKSYKVTIEDRPRDQLPQFKISFGAGILEPDFELKRARSLKKQEIDERNIQKRIESLKTMVQSINCTIQSELFGQPRMDSNQPARLESRRNAPIRRPLGEPVYNFEDFEEIAPRLTRNVGSHLQNAMSPRQFEEQQAFFVDNDVFQPMTEFDRSEYY